MLLPKREFLYDLRTFVYLRAEIGSPKYVTKIRQTKHEVICSLRATSSGDHREYRETAFSGNDIVACLSQRANCFQLDRTLDSNGDYMLTLDL